jgi:hypothetical protein
VTLPHVLSYLLNLLPKSLSDLYFITEGRDSSFGTRTRLRAVGRSKRFFSSPWRPDRFWGPPNLLSKE